MKRSHIIFLSIFFIAFATTFFWQRYHTPGAVIELKDQRLSVLVADTPERRYIGLGGRETLAPYDGMLFLFGNKGRHGFVMRNMSFPIDIVWFSDGVVVDIAPNVPLESGVDEAVLRRYYPRADANAVLELPSGWAAKYGLQIGDKITGAAQ